jgi:hypothetical protein
MNTFASFDEAMTATAARAVEIAAQGRVALDYSVESIRIVEEQLASLHLAIPKGFLAKLKKKGPSDEEIHVMAMTFGAYVGEVLKRRFGGQWSLESKLAPGTKVPTFHFANGGGEIWPQIKVEKRLRNGPEDNVWHYAQVLIDKLDGKSGSDA